jgi:uncharacterized protein (TIGR02118 family)
MTETYFLHVHGAVAARAAVAKAAEHALEHTLEHYAPGVAVLHTPIDLPDADPLSVEQDARLLVCQLDGPREAARLDAVTRAVPGVLHVAHQAMACERITPGAPDDPRAASHAVSWLVQYNGPAKDPAAFHAYYREHHVPIVHRMPGIRSLNWYVPKPWTPSAGLHAVGYLQLVQAVFGDLEGLLAMRRSAQRKAGLRDFANYPAFEGPVTHQAMTSRRIAGGRRG